MGGPGALRSGPRSALHQELGRLLQASLRGRRLGLPYLGRYTHRVGIGNSRLLAVDPQLVTFRTRGDKSTSLPPTRFLRRFLLHVLPKGFVRIRHYGLLAPSNVHGALEQAREQIRPRSMKAAPREEPEADDLEGDLPEYVRTYLQLLGQDLRRCPLPVFTLMGPPRFQAHGTRGGVLAPS